MTFIKIIQDKPGIGTTSIWINSDNITSIRDFDFTPYGCKEIQHGSIIFTNRHNEYYQDIYETPEEIVELIVGPTPYLIITDDTIVQAPFLSTKEIAEMRNAGQAVVKLDETQSKFIFIDTTVEDVPTLPPC